MTYKFQPIKDGLDIYEYTWNSLIAAILSSLHIPFAQAWFVGWYGTKKAKNFNRIDQDTSHGDDRG